MGIIAGFFGLIAMGVSTAIVFLKVAKTTIKALAITYGLLALASILMLVSLSSDICDDLGFDLSVGAALDIVAFPIYIGDVGMIWRLKELADPSAPQATTEEEKPEVGLEMDAELQ